MKEAARLGRHNLDLLGENGSDTPILFLEPSCYSMFAEDYRELKLPNTEQIAKRSFLFEKFVDDLLEREPDALRFNEQSANVAIHAHCHAKSILKPAFMARLAARLPGRKATLLDTGCCGMAGAFGALESKYELSIKVGADLVKKIKAQPSDAVVVASGTSCRHQIEHLTSIHPKQWRIMAELNGTPRCSLTCNEHEREAERESRNELDGMVVNIELTLVSIIQGVALTFLAENAREVLSAKQWSAVPYVLAGLLIILLFWSRSLIHTLTLIRWPLEFGHNFFYIACTLAEVLAFTRLSEPFWWFAMNALFSALVWGLFIYDLRMIRMRQAASHSEDASRLYKIVMRDQRLNIWFLVPGILLFNIACAIAIHSASRVFSFARRPSDPGWIAGVGTCRLSRLHHSGVCEIVTAHLRRAA